MLKKFTSSLLLVLCAVLSGCGTVATQSQATFPALGQQETSLAIYHLKALDTIAVQIKGLPVGSDSIEAVVDEEGYVALPYIGQIVAAGCSTSELEKSIYKAYIDGKIYKPSISVSVIAQQKSFYVWGEVRAPGRYPLAPGTTLMQAIASAGGYSPYANQRKIQLSRGADKYFFNGKELEGAPEKDPKIEADDVINVWRSFL